MDRIKRQIQKKWLRLISLSHLVDCIVREEIRRKARFIDRPAVLGVGGWTGSWELWAEPFSILSRRWRTIAYDHRGAGVTQAPVESITHDRLIDDVFAVMDAYQVERCVLAAESAGALTALGAALRHPERIAGLVLVDAMFYRAPSPEESPFVVGLRTHYAETLRRFVAGCVPEPDSEHLKAWGFKILSRASPADAPPDPTHRATENHS